MLRLVSADSYEIVYGERRYRASLLAGISAIIKNIPDNVAVEYALTESLKRKDVSPIEEAIAYKTLINSNNYDTATLVVKFGKSESLIHTVIIRVNRRIIQPFAELFLSDNINLSVALGITEKRYNLCDNDKLQIINNMTDEMKDTIRRDFIIAHLKRAFCTGVTEDLLLEFGKQHIPDELAEIKAKHQEVYDKRHARIMEKIEAIHAKHEARANR